MRSTNQKKDPPDFLDDFDPRRREDNHAQGSEADGANALVSRQDNVPAMFAEFIPNGRELSCRGAPDVRYGSSGTTSFAPSSHESEEIAHSTRRIMQEHMRIGGNVIHIMSRVQNHMITQLGDNRQVREPGSETRLRLRPEAISPFALHGETLHVLLRQVREQRRGGTDSGVQRHVAAREQ